MLTHPINIKKSLTLLNFDLVDRSRISQLNILNAILMFMFIPMLILINLFLKWLNYYNSSILIMSCRILHRLFKVDLLNFDLRRLLIHFVAWLYYIWLLLLLLRLIKQKGLWFIGLIWHIKLYFIRSLNQGNQNIQY